MKTSADFSEYIVDLLTPLGDITMQRMFSGILLRCNSVQIGVVWGDDFYFRVPAHLHAYFLDLGSEPFQYKKKTGVVTMKSYWLCPEDLLDSREEFLRLAAMVLE
jgi:DNA transformation protein